MASVHHADLRGEVSKKTHKLLLKALKLSYRSHCSAGAERVYTWRTEEASCQTIPGRSHWFFQRKEDYKGEEELLIL